MFYLQNTDDSLWYEVSLVGIGDDMTVVWGGDGLPTSPPYVPGDGDPLVSLAEYLAIMGLSALDVDSAVWTWAALYASDAVEAYCGTSWRVAVADPLLLETDDDYDVEVLTAPPYGLKTVVAMTIRGMIGHLGKSSAGGAIASTPGLVSESLRNYSYSLSPDVDATDLVSAYAGYLKPYRQLYVGA